jgi:hypothetical protein
MTVVIDRSKPTFQWLLEVVEELSNYGVVNIETSPNRNAVAEAANVLAILPRFFEGYDTIVRLKRPSSVNAWRISNRGNGTVALTVDHNIKYQKHDSGDLQNVVTLGCDCPTADVHGRISVSSQGVREDTTIKAVKRNAVLFNLLDRYLPEPKGTKFSISYMCPPGRELFITIPFQRQKPVLVEGLYEKYGVLEGNRQLKQKTWHAMGEALFAFAWGCWTQLGFEVLSEQKNLEELLKKANPREAAKINHHLPKAIKSCYEMMFRICTNPHEDFSKWRETLKMPAEHEGYYVSKAIHGLGHARRANARALVESYNENYAKPKGKALISAEQLSRAVDINFEQHAKSKELENSIFHKTIKRII